ncbi:hypothetical protein BOX15_Mlig024873g1 [Macrostomum lignano]|nr:hypothetical protein BOX15_Mlig024873g1 [Macrostomum lignano]
MQARLSGFIGLSPSHALAYAQEDFAHFKKVYTVLLYGTENDLPGEEAYKRFRLIPSARVIPVDSASHLHYVERPDIVNDIIIDALKALED